MAGSNSNPNLSDVTIDSQPLPNSDTVSDRGSQNQVWSPAYSFSYSLMTSFLTILLIYLAVSGLICGLKNLGCVRGNLSWQCTDFLVAIQELQSERASVVTGHGQWPPGMYCTMNSFFKISWILITLQYYSGFCHTLTWISRGVTCIPHPDPPSHLLTY